MKLPDPRTAIQEEMRAAFPAAEGRVADFYAIQQYHLGWRDAQLGPASFDPGKLLRPLLSLMACRAAGGDERRALPLAAGIQLIHDFSLIHDDIEDQSETRRGRATIWSLWGVAQGINAGDGMFTIAHLALHRLQEEGVLPEVILEIMKRFDQTIATICEGQFLDLSYEGNLRISEADYLAMISRKTAALIAAASGLGAIIGGADAALAKALFDFGQNLGLAFQIEDDLLGIWGDPEVTGKPRAGDLARRKVSLPIIHGLHGAERRDELMERYARPSTGDDDTQAILEILEQAGSRGYTEGVAAHYHAQAVGAIDNARGGDRAVLEEMKAIAASLLGRKR